MSSTRLVLLAIVLFAAPATSWSAVVAIPASKDNTIFQNQVNNSLGGGAGIFVGNNQTGANGSPRRGLLAFNIAGSIPSGATINSAQLSMYLGQSANTTTSYNVELHRLTADWGEGTAGSPAGTIGGTGNGFAAGVGDATWNARSFSPSTPTLWTTSGGDFVGASASTLVGTAADQQYLWSSAGMKTDVQNWLDGSLPNFGWALVNATENAALTFKAFYSKEAPQNSTGGMIDPGWHPLLTVTYSVPEPAAIALVLLSCPLAILRRRR